MQKFESPRDMVSPERSAANYREILTPAAGNAILAPTPNPENQGTSEHGNRLAAWIPVFVFAEGFAIMLGATV
ncbi:MAG: hypothetical protein ACUVQK_12155 [Thermogutta sp.]